MPTDEENAHTYHRIQLERLALGRDRDQARAASSTLAAVRATGSRFVARYDDGTIVVRLPGTAGDKAAPVVRLAEPARNEKPPVDQEAESLALTAIQASKDLAGKTATGTVYTVLPTAITGLRSAGIDDEAVRARVAEAFGDFWRESLPLRSSGAPPATAVMDPGVDPRVLQAVVTGLGKSANPPERLILTDARRPAPVVLPPGLTVHYVPSKGDALADAIGRRQPPPPPSRGNVVDATTRFRPGTPRRPGGGSSGRPIT
jgi:hypothetical protein